MFVFSGNECALFVLCLIESFWAFDTPFRNFLDVARGVEILILKKGNVIY